MKSLGLVDWASHLKSLPTRFWHKWKCPPIKPLLIPDCHRQHTLHLHQKPLPPSPTTPSRRITVPSPSPPDHTLHPSSCQEPGDEHLLQSGGDAFEVMLMLMVIGASFLIFGIIFFQILRIWIKRYLLRVSRLAPFKYLSNIFCEYFFNNWSKDICSGWADWRTSWASEAPPPPIYDFDTNNGAQILCIGFSLWILMLN